MSTISGVSVGMCFSCFFATLTDQPLQKGMPVKLSGVTVGSIDYVTVGIDNRHVCHISFQNQSMPQTELTAGIMWYALAEVCLILIFLPLALMFIIRDFAASSCRACARLGGLTRQNRGDFDR